MAKVRVKGLRKDFGSLEVLRGIDLNEPPRRVASIPSKDAAPTTSNQT